MPGFVDPAIQRKSNIVDERLVVLGNGVPLPSVVEISESGTCNRTCSFCPRSAPDFEDIKEFIPAGLLDKLTRQLGEVDYQGIFLFSGFVEPLLDKNIFRLVKLVSTNVPKAQPEMVTNGDVLNETRLRRLFDNGLATILISVYDGPEDVERFKEMCGKIGLRDDQYVIRHRYLPPEVDFGITLSNRAGLMANAEHKIDTPAEPLNVPCHYPHYTFFMDYLGDVLMCPHDWGKKFVVGNMHRKDFMDIWTDVVLENVRQRLAAGDRNFGPCAMCDVKGTLMGAGHVASWQARYELGNGDGPPAPVARSAR